MTVAPLSLLEYLVYPQEQAAADLPAAAEAELRGLMQWAHLGHLLDRVGWDQVRAACAVSCILSVRL